jgi:oligopeptide/dipeptide ABC transporter ATP-binding protein
MKPSVSSGRGSGKSVTALAMLGLLPERSAEVTGSIEFDGRELLTLSEREMRQLRGNHLSVIFQEPVTSLNPLRTVGWQITENIRKHRQIAQKDAKEQALELLKQTGISAPEKRLKQYPFELSGGMCQRAMIAMALACHPQILIADEPTTALDVTIQAQILALLRQLQTEMHMSIILITHDLGVVAENCDRVLVMYAGRVMESADCRELLASPLHPYTRGLLNAVPRITTDNRRLYAIPGTVPAPDSLPTGCVFHPRCEEADDNCSLLEPPLFTAQPGHNVRCHLAAPAEARAS